MRDIARRAGISANRAGHDTSQEGGWALETGTRRIESFSDGVLAVAITLLVLNLTSPKYAEGQLLAGLLRQWPAYLGYATSFLYIAVIWHGHHQAFARIRAVDRGVQFANIAVLITAVLVPFATEVLAEAVRKGNRADADTAVALYALIPGVLMCTTWWWLYRYLRFHPSLVHDKQGSYFPRRQLYAALGVAGYALGGALGYLASPVVALAVFFLMPLFYAVTAEDLLPRN
jgi:uncharacterized membrane protein